MVAEAINGGFVHPLKPLRELSLDRRKSGQFLSLFIMFAVCTRGLLQITKLYYRINKKCVKFTCLVITDRLAE